MSGPRERAELAAKQQRDAQEQAPSRPTRSTLVVATSPTYSVRDRAEQQASDAAGDPIDTTQHRGQGYTSGGGFNRSCRDSQTMRDYQKTEAAAPAVNSIANEYYVAEMKRQAEEKEAHNEAVRSGKLKYV